MDAKTDAESASGESTLGRDPREARLLGLARGGSREAFEELLAPQVAPLLVLARRLCGDPHWADDLVQEALLRAFVGLPGFRAESSLRTWMFKILVRLHAEPSRWKRSERATPLLDLEVPDRLVLEGLSAASGREVADRVAAAIERLPVRQRAALHLRAVEGLDYEAIAAVLGCKAGAARMLVLEARRKLVERLPGLLEP
jgi:RNA polymerase sigma-70 factor (ECF subfamily)